VINATSNWTKGFALALEAPGLKSVETPVPPIGPLSIRKVRFRTRGMPPDGDATIAATLELRGRRGELSHRVGLELKVVGPDRPRNVTFVSEIDDSVQYFSLRPATSLSPDDPPPAIALSCHGAAVKAHRQSGSYSSKDWFPKSRLP
jgi:hypothetical protein